MRSSGVTNLMPLNQQFWFLVNLQFHVREIVLQGNGCCVVIDEIPECDTHSHLGILRSVLPSSVHRTTERCSSAQSAFFALNAVGSHFGCLHLALLLNYVYSSLCIPILLYGCELWSLTKSEVTMLERVHR